MTPARAGRIRASVLLWWLTPDDPRAGGADLRVRSEAVPDVGRSPRGRGGYFVTWGVVT
ncbi:hypothetical protein SSCG_03225 [Streptomyces clavuligerus]|nr:hypothetical protein SSCG_03225 [Streptomyces clavuligerus]